jgi:ornithine carbamoyltransferase
MAYVGDGNNVCHELMFACVKLGMSISVATPDGYGPNPLIVKSAAREAQKLGTPVPFLTDDPMEAVKGADAVYTDVWTSMGQESEAADRLRIFAPYQVNAALMSRAAPGALFMHCLPAHRGHEVSDEVIDSEVSVVFDQAENRLHTQKALLATMAARP